MAELNLDTVDLDSAGRPTSSVGNAFSSLWPGSRWS